MSQNFVLLAAMFGFMYFLLIRPQKKQAETRKNMMESLVSGDIITTIGGIKGKIIIVMEDSIILEIADNVQIELIKTAVGQVITDDDDEDYDENDDVEIETIEEIEVDEKESL